MRNIKRALLLLAAGSMLVFSAGCGSKPAAAAENPKAAAATESTKAAAPAETQKAAESAEAKKEEKTGPVLDAATEDVSGQPVNTLDLFKDNKVTMVNIWASWCPPCVGEIPELQELSGRLAEKDCGIVGILLDGDDPEGLADAKEIMAEAGVTYPNVIATEEIMEICPVDAVPTTFFVDSSGKLIGKPIIGAAVEKYEPSIDGFLKAME